jgi:hypothetical protein
MHIPLEKFFYRGKLACQVDWYMSCRGNQVLCLEWNLSIINNYNYEDKK